MLVPYMPLARVFSTSDFERQRARASSQRCRNAFARRNITVCNCAARKRGRAVHLQRIIEASD